MLAACDLKEIELGRSDSFMGIFGSCATKSRSIGKLDTQLADILPYWMASGWYFVFERGTATVKPDQER